MKYKIIMIINLIFLFFSSLSAQSETETRNFIKTIPVEKETSLEISNKYGTIQVTPWKKDSVYIKAEVKAFASNQSRLTKMFDGITVNITDSKFLVRAETDFTQNINMLFESFKGMTSKLISYDSRVEINYYVSMPEYINLRIENKYGDIYMEDITGEFSVSLSNGSFKANSLSKGSVIKLAFCDATINSVISGKIDASFSEISIGTTEDLSINSISSRFDIKRAGTLRVDSRKDKFFVSNADVLQGTSYFTDYNIRNLKRDLNLSTKYGTVSADLIEKGFESVNINSGYTDISLGFDQGASYNLEIRHINSFLVLPDKNIKTERKTLNDDKKEYITFGTVGRNPGTTRVKIDATRGNIYLK
jgi:hypothetical protein